VGGLQPATEPVDFACKALSRAHRECSVPSRPDHQKHKIKPNPSRQAVKNIVNSLKRKASRLEALKKKQRRAAGAARPQEIERDANEPVADVLPSIRSVREKQRARRENNSPI